MDDFLKNEAEFEEENIKNETPEADVIEENDDEEYGSVYNPVYYDESPKPEDTKKMSRGLKVFTLVIVGIIALTMIALCGYLMGKNSLGFKNNKNQAVNLQSVPADANEKTTAQVYDDVHESVVGIMVYNKNGDVAEATGVVFSKDGYIITNDHIYAGVGNPKFKVYLASGKEYDAEFVAGDMISDLALLKIDATDLKPAVFGNSDEIVAGQKVIALSHMMDVKYKSAVTEGIVSLTSARVRTTSNYSSRVIQTTCALNPGASGGALLNMHGQVVGIISSKVADTGYDNVGYAIPTTIMKRIVDELIKEGKIITRAKLGITYNFVDSVSAEIKGVDYVGAVIASVSEDSGLYGEAEEGDVITHIGGMEILDDAIMLDVMEEAKAGDTIELEILTTSGVTKTVTAELKANIGESSYSLDEEKPNGNGNKEFDFPEGE